MSGENTGHGHVRPRPDGLKARCGGPAICGACAREVAQQEAMAEFRKQLEASARQPPREDTWIQLARAEANYEKSSAERDALRKQLIALGKEPCA
jgi:ferredoxin